MIRILGITHIAATHALQTQFAAHIARMALKFVATIQIHIELIKLTKATGRAYQKSNTDSLSVSQSVSLSVCVGVSESLLSLLQLAHNANSIKTKLKPQPSKHKHNRMKVQYIHSIQFYPYPARGQVPSSINMLWQ